ncbi:unnamed protein product [Caenorhabditis angaria]|uniref:Target of rapamycin complex subunit lst8 n=1 Tax=Caenorhabditis angaria TaxID=860376 RepID=A0A9P1I153_9PELO|nr:unnamed protein product [Caenorhabditis angaria]
MPENLLVSASYDQTIKIWNIADGRMEATIQHNEGQVNALSLTTNGRDLALGAWQKVRIYDVSMSKDPKATIDLPKNVTVVGFEISGRWMYTGGDDGACRIWEMRSNQLVANRTLSFTPAQVTSMVPHVNQTEMFISTNAGQVIVWDVTSNETHQLPMPEKLGLLESVQKLSVRPDGKRLSGITNRGRLLCWDVKTRQIDPVPNNRFDNIIQNDKWYGTLINKDNEDCRLNNGYGLSCRYSSDGSHIVASSSGPDIHVFNAETLRQVATLRTDCEWNWDAIFSPDGKHIFSGGSDAKIKVWETATASRVTHYEGHVKPITAMCINNPPPN